MVIDGFKKAWEVQCEACGKGYEGPQGVEAHWEVSTGASKVTITGLDRMDGDHVIVQVAGINRRTYEFSELYKTEAEALAESERYQAEFREQNTRSAEARNTHRRAETAWTVRYHNQCIKDYETKIAWHRSKVQEKVLLRRAGKAPS